MISRTAILGVALIGAALSSCIRDNVDTPVKIGGEKGNGSNTVTFVLSVPQSGNALKTRSGAVGDVQGGNGHTVDGKVPAGYRNYNEDADFEANGTVYGGYPDADAESAAFERAVRAMSANYQRSPMKKAGAEAGAGAGETSPATEGPGTRAITEYGENDYRVDEITIVLFDPTTRKYVDHIRIPASDISNMGDYSRKKFTLTLPDCEYQALYFANSWDLSVGPYIVAAGADLENRTIADFQSGLTILHTGKWISDPTDPAFKPFPMASKPVKFKVPAEVDYTREPIPMVRALAKINIKTTLGEDFKIGGVLLLNRNAGGYLAPADGWSSGSGALTDADAVRPLSSSFVETDFNNPALVEGLYNYSAGGYDGYVNEVTDEIFLFESTPPANPADAPCLIVMAYVNTDTFTQVGNFRVDLTRTDPVTKQREYVNVVRNFTYTINITGCNTRPYRSTQEAYDHPGGLTTDITALDEKGMNDVTYNGEYQLAVDRSVVILSPDASKTSHMRIYTDYELGWRKLERPPVINPDLDFNATATPSSTSSANGAAATAVEVKRVGNTNNNTSGETQKAKFHVIAGALDKLITVVQLPYSQNVVDNLPANVNRYVGAFWRANQTGERLIRVPRPTSGDVAAIDGAWEAYVLDGADWVVLDTKPSTDAGIASGTPSMSGNDPNFDRIHKVSGSQTWAWGELTADNPELYFRIGLKSVHVPTPEQPARYATVLVTYAGGTYSQLLYIRQGENPDYLMYPNDNSSNGALASRPKAMKFSPYNLTAAEFMNNGGVTASVQGRVEVRPGGAPSTAVFADYPTQAGAFFTYATTETKGVYAYNPSGVKTTVPPVAYADPWLGDDMETQHPSGTVADNHESCPEGYRRPSIGNDAANVTTVTIANSEPYQSLAYDPRAGIDAASASTANSVFGHYADGFFDRRSLDTELSNMFNYPWDNTAVSANISTVAYRGRLFYNPEHNNSIFFPFAGHMDRLSGANYESGGVGNYLTSSVMDTGNSYVFHVGRANLQMERHGASNGFPLRCVEAHPSLKVTPTTLTFNDDEYGVSGAQSVQVEYVGGNGGWSATPSSTNFECVPIDDETLSVRPTSANTGTADRTATITISANGVPDVTVTVTQLAEPQLIPRPIYATPGVLGIKKSDIGKTSGFSLTLKGSSTFRNSILATGGDGISTLEFGEMENEPVYPVHFSGKSSVAMVLDVSGEFHPNSIVWINPEYGGNNNLAGALAAVKAHVKSASSVPGEQYKAVPGLGLSESMWVTDAASANAGHADPCTYAVGKSGVNYVVPTLEPGYTTSWENRMGSPFPGMGGYKSNTTYQITVYYDIPEYTTLVDYYDGNDPNLTIEHCVTSSDRSVSLPAYGSLDANGSYQYGGTAPGMGSVWYMLKSATTYPANKYPSSGVTVVYISSFFIYGLQGHHVNSSYDRGFIRCVAE